MYDDFSQTYDRFVNWQSRLDYEMPFIEAQLAQVADAHLGGRGVLDAACGTGWHVIALAQRGYQAVGADLSLPMVERARLNAAQAGIAAAFFRAGFGELAETLKGGAGGTEQPLFDAVLCLGNSLPHVLDPQALGRTLEDFAACLRPDGMLLIQNRNFDAILSQRERWMEPQSHQAEGEEWLFLRFYDFRPDGLIDFNVVSLHRAGGSPWQQRSHSTTLYPLRQRELASALTAASFERIESFGDMQGGPFASAQSGNLVVVCRRR